MEILTIGVNHTSAPVEVREKLALLPEELPQALAALGQHLPGALILSTCNRTEIYATVMKIEAGLKEVEAFFRDYHHLEPEKLAPYLRQYRNEEAVRHLFAVASGIDSMVLGETEVLGQVGDALGVASEQGRVGKSLVRLFHHALRTGRRARTETGISRHALSVSSAAVQVARKVFDGLGQSRVLVISAGEAGKLTAKTLKDEGVARIGVANRTRAKAEALAGELGGEVVGFDSVPAALMEYDIVISATASAHFVISADMVGRAMERRGGRQLCLVDIAVPRDIDPECRQIAGVHLYNIDDLEAVTLANRAQREREKEKVEVIISDEVARYIEWQRDLDVVPVIVALQQKVEAVRQRELEKSLRKLEHLAPEDVKRIEDLTSALTRKLLHDPILTLKEQDGSKEFIESARELFRLNEK